jgi:hypothetical protein
MLTETVPFAVALEQFVVEFEITTLYVPATLVINDATFPGLETPVGTVQL